MRITQASMERARDKLRNDIHQDKDTTRNQLFQDRAELLTSMLTLTEEAKSLLKESLRLLESREILEIATPPITQEKINFVSGNLRTVAALNLPAKQAFERIKGVLAELEEDMRNNTQDKFKINKNGGDKTMQLGEQIEGLKQSISGKLVELHSLNYQAYQANMVGVHTLAVAMNQLLLQNQSNEPSAAADSLVTGLEGEEARFQEANKPKKTPNLLNRFYEALPRIWSTSAPPFDPSIASSLSSNPDSLSPGLASSFDSQAAAAGLASSLPIGQADALSAAADSLFMSLENEAARFQKANKPKKTPNLLNRVYDAVPRIWSTSAPPFDPSIASSLSSNPDSLPLGLASSFDSQAAASGLASPLPIRQGDAPSTAVNPPEAKMPDQVEAAGQPKEISKSGRLSRLYNALPNIRSTSAAPAPSTPPSSLPSSAHAEEKKDTPPTGKRDIPKLLEAAKAQEGYLKKRRVENEALTQRRMKDSDREDLIDNIGDSAAAGIVKAIEGGAYVTSRTVATVAAEAGLIVAGGTKVGKDAITNLKRSAEIPEEEKTKEDKVKGGLFSAGQAAASLVARGAAGAAKVGASALSSVPVQDALKIGAQASAKAVDLTARVGVSAVSALPDGTLAKAAEIGGAAAGFISDAADSKAVEEGLAAAGRGGKAGAEAAFKARKKGGGFFTRIIGGRG